MAKRPPRVTLYGLKFEDFISTMLKTPPPPPSDVSARKQKPKKNTAKKAR
jgi:hypothetical protein